MQLYHSQFPKICREEVSIHVIQSRDHILNTVRILTFSTTVANHDIANRSIQKKYPSLQRYNSIDLYIIFALTHLRRINLPATRWIS